MKFFIYCIIFTLFSQYVSTVVYNSNKKLTIEIQSFNNEDVIVRGLNNQNFVKLDQNEDIHILCTKQNHFKSGQITAFINTQQAQTVKCLEYNSDHIGDDIFCIKQEFKFSLPSRGYSYYDVLCRFTTEYDSGVRIIMNRLC